MQALVYNISQISHTERLTNETLLLVKDMVGRDQSTAELFEEGGGICACVSLLEDSFASETSSEVLLVFLSIIPEKL